jgi:hypothetical protein
MKKGEIVNSIIMRYNCKYNYFVLGNNNIVFSVHLFRDFKGYKNLSYPFVLEGDLKMKDIKFMLRRPDLGLIAFYELKELLITDYYSRFKYYIYKTIPETFNYTHIVETRYINEDQCDVRSSVIYDNDFSMSEKEFNSTLIFMNNVYKSIEASLRHFSIFKLSTLNIMINTKIELIWNILRNMKLIHKYVNLLGHKINYKGNILKKKDIIEIFNINKDKECKTMAKVIKCKYNKNGLAKECIIEIVLKKENNPFSLNTITFLVYEFNNQCSLYILYKFVNIIDNSFSQKFTKRKNNELLKFKCIVEKYKESNNI